MHNIGTDFVWFMGVVEDRNDPLQMGRVRVRTHWQTADKDILPTDDLPWAQITVPSSATSGDVGGTSTGYAEGSWVVGFFMDGEHKQHPLILGAISGIPTKQPDPECGFNDPRGVYPQRLNEPDMNRLVRTRTIREESRKLLRTEEETNANLHPSISFRNDYVDDLTGEPIPSRDSEYPYSQVRETESGHIQEFDDTLGSERISTMHRTGTMEEYHPDGSRVNRTMKDNYHITYGDDYVRVRGVSKVYVDGDASLYVRGKLVTQVDGDMETYVAGNYNMDVGGSINVTTNGGYTLEAKKAINQTTTSTYTSSSSGKMTFSTKDKLLAQSEKNFDINTKDEFRVRSSEIELHSADGNITLYSSKNITGFYCDRTDFYNICVYESPDTIAAVTVPDALILESYTLKEFPSIFPRYSRKLDVGKGFQDVYNDDLGPTPGGEQSGSAPDDSGQNPNSSSKYETDVTTTSEAITTSRLVGNSGLTDSNNRPIGQQVEDFAAHGKDKSHLNVLDVALSAKDLGPHAWVDGDAAEGRAKYSNPGNPNILGCFEEMGVLSTAKSINPTRYDKTAWCAAFAGAMLRRSGNKYLKTLSSRAYERNASKIGILVATTYEPDKMKPGDILVFGRSGKSGKPFRSSPYGHIGFWTGNKNAPAGKIMCIGGNQSNRVTVRPYSIEKGTEFGLVAVIRPVSGNDGKTPQPDPGAIREIVADKGGSDRVT
jgi:hypothetical protein